MNSTKAGIPPVTKPVTKSDLQDQQEPGTITATVGQQDEPTIEIVVEDTSLAGTAKTILEKGRVDKT